MVTPLWEERIGSIIASAGIAWSVYHATLTIDVVQSFSNIMLKRGPLEVCGLGIMVWLHAKYRRSTTRW